MSNRISEIIRICTSPSEEQAYRKVMALLHEELVEGTALGEAEASRLGPAAMTADFRVESAEVLVEMTAAVVAKALAANPSASTVVYAEAEKQMLKTKSLRLLDFLKALVDRPGPTLKRAQLAMIAELPKRAGWVGSTQGYLRLLALPGVAAEAGSVAKELKRVSVTGLDALTKEAFCGALVALVTTGGASAGEALKLAETRLWGGGLEGKGLLGLAKAVVDAGLAGAGADGAAKYAETLLGKAAGAGEAIQFAVLEAAVEAGEGVSAFEWHRRTHDALTNGFFAGEEGKPGRRRLALIVRVLPGRVSGLE